MYKNLLLNIINIIFFTLFLLHNNYVYAISDNESRLAIIEIHKRLEKDQISKLQLATQIQDIQQELSQLRNQIEFIYNSKNSENNINYQKNKYKSEEQEYYMYEYAMTLFNKGKYKEAEESFMAFKAVYYNSELEPEIIFFLGSTKYALKNFKGAIEELNNLTKLYPNNTLTAEAMLIIANSQLELDSKITAKNTLKLIIKKYPESKASITANNRLKIL